jgi:hypothetical protein
MGQMYEKIWVLKFSREKLHWRGRENRLDFRRGVEIVFIDKCFWGELDKRRGTKGGRVIAMQENTCTNTINMV